jgi:hypothetical protein
LAGVPPKRGDTLHSTTRWWRDASSTPQLPGPKGKGAEINIRKDNYAIKDKHKPRKNKPAKKKLRKSVKPLLKDQDSRGKLASKTKVVRAFK